MINQSKEKKIVIFRLSPSSIRPFPNQPRKKFNMEALKQLGQSILEKGQQVPISVKKIRKKGDYKYELIDGERRLRACLLLNIPHINALVCRDVKDENDQFTRSLISNFCREDHTSIEIMLALTKLKEDFVAQGKGEVPATESIGRLLGKSTDWVYRYLRLTHLHPSVRKMLEQDLIPFPVADALTCLKAEIQVKKAAYIIKHGLNYKRALAYIRKHKTKKNVRSAAVIDRQGTTNEFRVLQRFICGLEENSKIILDMNHKTFREIFRLRSKQEFYKIISRLETCIDNLTSLKESFEKIRDEFKR
jgi:ParB/RepB/Spo0J family partition protein